MLKNVMSVRTTGACIVTLARSVGRSDSPCAWVTELAGTITPTHCASAGVKHVPEGGDEPKVGSRHVPAGQHCEPVPI